MNSDESAKWVEQDGLRLRFPGTVPECETGFDYKTDCL